MQKEKYSTSHLPTSNYCRDASRNNKVFIIHSKDLEASKNPRYCYYKDCNDLKDAHYPAFN